MARGEGKDDGWLRAEDCGVDLSTFLVVSYRFLLCIDMIWLHDMARSLSPFRLSELSSLLSS